MGIESLIGSVFENGAVLGLALVCLWMLNRVWADRVATEKANGERWAALAKENQAVVKANTEAITQLCERLKDGK